MPNVGAADSASLLKLEGSCNQSDEGDGRGDISITCAVRVAAPKGASKPLPDHIRWPEKEIGSAERSGARPEMVKAGGHTRRWTSRLLQSSVAC